MIWTDINKSKPVATETGCWDGKRSSELLVETMSGKYYVCYMYHAIMDGSESFDFYDYNDNEVRNVKYWTEIS